MAGKLGKFQTLSFSSWKGLTTENHLGAIYKKSPLKASDMMVQLLASARGKTLESFLSLFPTKQFENDEEYTWEVIGSNRRNISLLEARTLDNNPVAANSGMIGAGTVPFYLVFAEDWFADGRHAA